MILASKKILCVVWAVVIMAPLAFACTESAPSADSYSYSLLFLSTTDGSYCANNVGASFGSTMRGSVVGLASGAENIAGWTRGGAEFISTALHQTLAHAKIGEGSASYGPLDSLLASLAKTTSSLLRTLSSFFSALGSAIWPS